MCFWTPRYVNFQKKKYIYFTKTYIMMQKQASKMNKFYFINDDTIAFFSEIREEP